MTTSDHGGGNNQNSLRDRIAAVLNRHKTDGDRHNEWSDCQCGHVGTRWDDHVADAVIEELVGNLVHPYCIRCGNVHAETIRCLRDRCDDDSLYEARKLCGYE